ncbi:MAG: segregation and condensation protein A [Gammaproteobacteria bacterium]|nr:segregation and condensation protein A [Gammaproteobacteria bacterium]
MSYHIKERQILEIMRKVLGSIIKDTTPPPGMQHPLSKGTINDVRACFALITAREKELAEAAGELRSMPGYIDEPVITNVVPLSSIGKSEKDE